MTKEMIPYVGGVSWVGLLLSCRRGGGAVD